MVHWKLLTGMTGLLLVVSGGIFILVKQSENETEIARFDWVAQEALVAGVSTAQEQNEIPEQEVAENKSVEKEIVSPPVVQPAPKATPTTPSPSQAPKPQPLVQMPLLPSTQTSAHDPRPPIVSSPEPLEPPLTPTPTPSPPEISFPININTAVLEELGQITGIGPAIAQRIIDYRNAHCQFQHIEDIKNVSGIGDVNFEKMREEITVGDTVVNSPPSLQLGAKTSGKININIASYEELQKITGVGEVIAQRIIEYREKHGPFEQVEEIKNVKGIGNATFEKMRDEITL